MDKSGDISNSFLTEYSKVAQRLISAKNQSINNYWISYWENSENQIFWNKIIVRTRRSTGRIPWPLSEGGLYVRIEFWGGGNRNPASRCGTKTYTALWPNCDRFWWLRVPLTESFSVAYPASLFPFVPLCFSSVCDSCPCPFSRLCLPLCDSFPISV